jgi:hypothetical protein
MVDKRVEVPDISAFGFRLYTTLSDAVDDLDFPRTYEIPRPPLSKEHF